MIENHFETIRCLIDVQRILANETATQDSCWAKVFGCIGDTLDAQLALLVSINDVATECRLLQQWTPSGAPVMKERVFPADDLPKAFFTAMAAGKPLVQPIFYRGQLIAYFACMLREDGLGHAPETLRFVDQLSQLLAPSVTELVYATGESTIKEVNLALNRDSELPDDGLIHALIVEDDHTNQLILRKFLERCGAVAHVAPTGQAAIEACLQQRFDIIFMDLTMPLMDGFDATRQIATSCALNQRTPIIAVTADTSSGIERRCEKIGMKHYLSKPIRLEQIAELMSQVPRRG